MDNPQTGDETEDLVSHVNFAGTKPKSSKIVNPVKKSPKTVSSPYSASSDKTLKAEAGTSTEKNKKIIPKKYVDSDSDSISDVDEELMQTQTSLIEKIMSLDKCQRASGVKPSFAKNSIGIKKIDKTKPAKTSFIDVRKLKTIKNLNKPSKNINTTQDETTNSEESNDFNSKNVVSPAEEKKPSRISDDFENISVIAKSPKKRNSLDDSTLIVASPKKHTSIDESTVIKSPKKPKSLDIKVSKRKTKVNGNQNNNNISLEVKNTTGDSLVTTSTPFPTIFDKAKKSSHQKECNDVAEIKDSKKKLSFSNVSSDNCVMPVSNDATLESKESNSKKTKLSKKSKHDSDSFISTNNSSQNEDFDTDFSQSSSISKKLLKKKHKQISDSYDSTSSIIMNTPPVTKSNIFQKHPAIVGDMKKSRADLYDSMLGSPCDSSLKSKKRKRKSSDSSINLSGITSDEMHQSDVSNTVSHRKKRRKNNEPGEPPSQVS